MGRIIINIYKIPAIICAEFCINCRLFDARFNIAAALILSAAILPTRVNSSQDISQICDQAAVYAAHRTGVPTSVLRAISLTETGREIDGIMRPWPWAVNMEGKGVWFDTEDEARAYVYKNYKEGARSFDVGCFQINYKWHGQEFTSIDEMFQPNPNALYAANFLLKLFREKGDWGSAAGAYHSRTQKYADKYELQFNANRMALLKGNAILTPEVLSEEDAQSLSIPDVGRVNNFPLLQENSNSRTLGSLVPLGVQQSSMRLINAGE